MDSPIWAKISGNPVAVPMWKDAWNMTRNSGIEMDDFAAAKKRILSERMSGNGISQNGQPQRFKHPVLFFFKRVRSLNPRYSEYLRFRSTTSAALV